MSLRYHGLLARKILRTMMAMTSLFFSVKVSSFSAISLKLTPVIHFRMRQNSISEVYMMKSPLFDSDYDDSSASSSLSDRIAQVKRNEESFVSGLQKRVKSIARAEEFDQTLAQVGPTIVDLPVICFDALLPNQRLTGSTTDPTFSRFLQSIGLGGSFVITSLNSRQRKLRRFGVIARVEIVDADEIEDIEETNNYLSTPTSVTFSIVGKRRCEILGPLKDMKERVGRWRRVYDPNGEEARLGWGEERFLDKSDDSKYSHVIWEKSNASIKCDDFMWSTNRVHIIDEEYEDSNPSSEAIASAAYLIPIIERWISLASEQATYDNVDVVARTRHRAGEPGLSVNASALIRKVQLDLGPMPSPQRPTAFALWGAALINPLPPLGVAIEIRGAVLDAVGAERKLAVLERGLVKSINNLDGTTPLNM